MRLIAGCSFRYVAYALEVTGEFEAGEDGAEEIDGEEMLTRVNRTLV